MAENQLSSFQNAQQRTDEQKRALLSAIAQHGSAGKQQYDQAQQELNQGRTAAVNEAATRAGAIGAPAEYLAQARQQAASGYDMRSTDLAQNQAAFGADMERQGATNEQFFGQLGAAIPITESRTRAAVEQIIREQEEARQAREMEAQMRREEQEFRRQMQAMDLEGGRIGLATARANASGGGRGGPSISEQIAIAKFQEGQEKSAQDQAMEQSRRFVLGKLQQSASPNTANAFMTAVSGAKDITDALARIRGGYAAATGPNADPKAAAMFKGVSVPKLEDWVRRYYQPTQEEIGMALGLVPIPKLRQVGPSIMGAKIMRAR